MHIFLDYLFFGLMFGQLHVLFRDSLPEQNRLFWSVFKRNSALRGFLAKIQPIGFRIRLNSQTSDTGKKCTGDFSTYDTGALC